MTIILRAPDRPRRRIGQWRIFAKRYVPVDFGEGRFVVGFDKLSRSTDPRTIWSVVAAGDKHIAKPGIIAEGSIGHIITRRGWCPVEKNNPGFAVRIPLAS